MSNDLTELRQQIDEIDQQIHQLLNQRARCAQQVAEVKMRDVASSNHPKAGADDSSDATEVETPLFYRPEREAQVLRKVIERNEGPIDDTKIAHIFREIMSACLALEKPLEVAYLGPEGTFTEAAALKHFGHAVIPRPMPSISDVFSAVQRKNCDYGVLPVENSTEGMVAHTLDNLLESPLKICGELALPINLHLLAHEEANPDSLTRICAHQQALAQSRNWLRQHFPNVPLEAVSSNGEAARLASQDPNIAAVAGDIAMERYSLRQLASDIQDYANNTTRFLVLSHEDVPASGDDKTSIAVSTRNKPGALYELLAPLAEQGISMTRIETRPSRTENWAYVFFIEFCGHREDEVVAKVIDIFKGKAGTVKVLGSYPAAVI